jgi:hypothetical protein
VLPIGSFVNFAGRGAAASSNSITADQTSLLPIKEGFAGRDWKFAVMEQQWFLWWEVAGAVVVSPFTEFIRKVLNLQAYWPKYCPNLHQRGSLVLFSACQKQVRQVVAFAKTIPVSFQRGNSTVVSANRLGGTHQDFPRFRRPLKALQTRKSPNLPFDLIFD